MIDPFNEMAIFATIADHGSFTGAARALGRSKAYVSQQMTKLEETLNIQLLYRTTRKVSLTEAGKVYLGYCQDIIRSGEEAKQSIAALQGEMTGLIKVSATNSFGEILLSDCLFEFQNIYPNVEIDLDLSDAVYDLKSKSIDLVIRGGAVMDDDLVSIPLIQWHMLVVGTPGYLQKHGTPNSPEELVHHNCIGVRGETRDAGWPFIIDGTLKRIHVNGSFSANRNPLIKRVTMDNKGLAWVPSYIVQKELAEESLISVLDEFCPPPFSFYLAYLYQRAIPLRQRRLIDFIKDWFAKREMPGLYIR